MQLICSSGYTPNPQFHYMDSVLRKEKVDIVDEHYYQTVPWFLMNAGKYDHYDRNGPKIFIGEYACHSVRIGSANNKNTLICALAEAAWMTGLERNADVVVMAAYAPLFAHVKDWQWTPNLIWFDNSTSYNTPSYCVQQLFSLNKGTDVVNVLERGQTIAGLDSIWASAVLDRNTHEIIIKLVNPSSSPKQKTFSFDAKIIAAMQTILGGHPDDMNSISQPQLIAPVKRPLKTNSKKLDVAIDPYSFNVIKIAMAGK